MPRITKKQRRARRERKRRERNKRRVAAPKQNPWTSPKMKLFRLPDLFPEGMSRADRLQRIRTVGAKAAEDFAQEYPKLALWFQNYDALYLLSFSATYFLSYREGTDPELEGRGFFPHYQEIMQAFALTQDRAHTLKPLLQDATRLKEEMTALGRAMQLRLLNIPDHISEDDELYAYYLRMQMMAQTTAVRNWAYFHQIKRIVLDLAKLIARDFVLAYGMDPADFFQMLFALSEERTVLLNQHRDKLQGALRGRHYKEILSGYNGGFPENRPISDEEAEQLWNWAGHKRGTLKFLLVAHADLRLPDIYSFTLEHARSLLQQDTSDTVLAGLLDRLTYRFGDLKQFNKEHIVLGNPILTRPFIQAEENSYFSSIWAVFSHLALDILEGLVWDNEALRKRYTDVKSIYLEDETERLLRAAFPHGKVHRGSLWADKSTGQQYENDLIVVLESFAIVVEAKSGGVSDPARRGAPKRLVETLRALIEEPADQALRFIRFLSSERREHSFQTERGERNVIDSRAIKYFVPLGVTFSNLGMLGSNLKRLIEAKVVDKGLEDLAPSISLTDLEVILELLPREVEKIHYFARRREFEAHMEYQGDEMDLLAFYLDNGFNIGEDEYSGALYLNLLMKSKELDPYFIGTSEGRVVPKPQLAMSRWWRDILDAISKRRREHWVEMGFILLNSTKQDQKEFERMFKMLMRQIQSGRVEKAHNWIMFASGPERRRYLIAGYPYTTTDRDLRNNVMSEILTNETAEKARGAIVIGVQLARLDYPYSVLACRVATDLFDVLTLAQPNSLGT